jgi:hypothetical protein
MTTAWHALTSPWGLVCLGAYAVIVVVLLAANHAAHREEPDSVFRIVSMYPPPVPESDRAWLSPWPSAVDDAALTDLEFVSLIATTWEWPDTEDAS